MFHKRGIMTTSAASRPVTALLERYARQADDVARLLSGLPENAITQRAIPDKWSLSELLCHVRRVQQIFVSHRLEPLLATDQPELGLYDPDEDEDFEAMCGEPTLEVLAAYLDERRELVERLAALTPEQWDRAGHHPIYPQSDVHTLFEYVVHHEAHHVYQLFQRRALISRVPR
jgi:uncharacterized damage-inducible protein DinB